MGVGEGGERRIEAEDQRVPGQQAGKRRGIAEGALRALVALDEGRRITPQASSGWVRLRLRWTPSLRRKTSDTSPIIDGLRSTFIGLPLASHWAELML
jgi:hypothetical protein